MTPPPFRPPFRPPQPPPDPLSAEPDGAEPDGGDSALTTGEAMTVVNRPSPSQRKVHSDPKHPIPGVGSTIPVADRPTDPGAAGGPPSAVTLVNGVVSSAPPTVTDVTDVPAPRLAEPTPVPVAPQPPVVQPVLRVLRGEKLDVLPYLILNGKNYIGRSTPDKPADIDITVQERIEQVWASRQHAVVSFENGVVQIEDLNSLNGTFVNRVRLHPGLPRPLLPGDIVQIGTVQLRFEV